MGHLIEAFGSTCKAISRIEIGAFNTLTANLFYESLDAQKYNNGVSGSGDSAMYQRAQIEKAKEKLKYLEGEPKDSLLNDGNNEVRGKFLELFGLSCESVTKEENIKDSSVEIKSFFTSILTIKEDEFKIEFG